MPAELEFNILKVLTYFDLFDYPITKEELFSFLAQPADMVRFSCALERLLESGRLYLTGGFYMLRNDASLADRRLSGNLRAQPLLRTGKKISRLLYQVPFVRAIGISGSLSKNFAGEDADIDYFIITSSNRLWVARTMMHFIKKLSYLLGRQHWYCMNYYLDEEAMEIAEKNIFTAIELITLLPVQGMNTMIEFYRRNEWTREYYPNFEAKHSPAVFSDRSSLLKRALEYLLKGRMGERLDNYFMTITTRRWKIKEALQKRSVRGTRMSLFGGKHFSKPNPALFQKEILDLYNEKIGRLKPVQTGYFA
jgi:predicted nucleotidyltransferase